MTHAGRHAGPRLAARYRDENRLRRAGPSGRGAGSETVVHPRPAAAIAVDTAWRPRTPSRPARAARIASSHRLSRKPLIKSVSCSKHLSCITLIIAAACCTPKRSISLTLADAVGTPFYCYSSATIERHYKVFAGAFADVDALVCYAMKANSNQAVIATLAKLGAGADVVSGGELLRARAAGVPPDKIMFSGVGKTADELALAVDAEHSLRQCRSPSPSSNCSPHRRRQGPHRRHFDPRQSRRRSEDPRQDRDRQGGEQIRHSDQPRARGLCACRQAQGRAHHRRRHAYRQPDHRARSVRRRVCAARRFRRRAARRRPHHRAYRSRRRSGHSLSRGQRAAARSGGLCGDRQARDARISAAS